MSIALSIFKDIANIPHGSYDEKALSDYVVEYARTRGLVAVQDASNNVLVRIPATPGYEQSAPVLLQGHLDMVCDKAAGSDHDFLRDPIRLVQEGDILRADGTTLGADDAVAIAYGLALIDEDAPHPPLELLFTVEEEVSMKGVRTFDPAFFQARMLINLDSSGEGKITVSSAGGVAVVFTATAARLKSTALPYKLTVGGLLGGHTGGEIHMERGNANKLLCRVLLDLLEHTQTGVASLEGGIKTNAIPLEACATIRSDQDLSPFVEKWDRILKEEYMSSDKGVFVSLEKMEDAAPDVFVQEDMLRVLGAIAVIPNGPLRRNLDLGIVVASNCLVLLNTKGDEITIYNNLRSNGEIYLDEAVTGLEWIARAFGMESVQSKRYPGWDYQPDSRLRQTAIGAWRQLRGGELGVEAIHAGLEIGYILEKIPGLDAISFGPNTSGGHTIYEQMSVSSFQRTYEFLLELLRQLR